MTANVRAGIFAVVHPGKQFAKTNSRLEPFGVQISTKSESKKTQEPLTYFWRKQGWAEIGS